MKKKRTNSRNKGARIEREAAKFLQSLGFECERAARNGVHNGHDLMHNIKGAHLEIKGDESIDIGRLALERALDQAEVAAPEGCEPLVLWKKNRTGWRLTKRESSGIWTTTGDASIKAELLKHTEIEQ